MLRIACPFCGVRDHSEFTYLGDAEPQRPAHQDQDAKRWFDYVYLRDNPCGKISEYWHHLHGCREWLVVHRDTQTHEIFGAELARDFNAKRNNGLSGGIGSDKAGQASREQSSGLARPTLREGGGEDGR